MTIAPVKPPVAERRGLKGVMELLLVLAEMLQPRCIQYNAFFSRCVINVLLRFFCEVLEMEIDECSPDPCQGSINMLLLYAIVGDCSYKTFAHRAQKHAVLTRAL